MFADLALTAEGHHLKARCDNILRCLHAYYLVQFLLKWLAFAAVATIFRNSITASVSSILFTEDISCHEWTTFVSWDYSSKSPIREQWFLVTLVYIGDLGQNLVRIFICINLRDINISTLRTFSIYLDYRVLSHSVHINIVLQLAFLIL